MNKIHSLLLVVLIIGSISTNEIYIYKYVDNETPFHIEIIKFDPENGYIEYEAMITNETSVKADGQLHVKNSNGNNLTINGLWIDDNKKVSYKDYTKGQQYIEVIPEADLISGKKYNATLTFDPNGDERISLIWGTSSTEVTIGQDVIVEIYNELIDIDISARASLISFTNNSSTVDYIDPFDFGASGQLSVPHVSWTGNQLFCGLNVGACGGVPTSEHLVKEIIDTPVVASVRYNSSFNYGLEESNRTFEMWSGDDYVTIITNSWMFDDQPNQVGASAVNFWDFAATDTYRFSQAPEGDIPASANVHTNLTEQWAYMRDISEGKSVYEHWAFFNITQEGAGDRLLDSNYTMTISGAGSEGSTGHDQNGVDATPLSYNSIQEFGFAYGDITDNVMLTWS